MEVEANPKIKNIISSYFQNVDEEISEYIHNVLNEGRKGDFTNPEDIYECLGELFQDVRPKSTEQSIYELCVKIFDQIVDHKSSNAIQEKLSKLDAPVHLGSIFDQESKSNDYNGIWCAQKEVQSTVNKKKLIKAEAKAKQKQDRRDIEKASNESNTINWQKEATTSQMISKTAMKADEFGKSKDIKIENFDIAFGDKKLLQNAELSLSFGRRYGLVGRNGTGKSTTLRMIANRSLLIPKHISILFVEQEVIGDETSAIDAVLESDEVRTKLIKEEKMLLASNDDNASARLQEIYNQLQAIEADKAPARASKILVGLGFTPEMQERCTKTFSGGWRMRISLARALFSRPDLLLLDEPSNMLDSKSIIWLQKYLVTSWTSILLIVSHDQAFLNEVSTDILHLHSQRIDAYKGDYDYYEKTKIERRKNQEKEYEAQLAFRKHVQEFIDKFRYNAKRASLVQSKIKMIEKLLPLVPVEKEQTVVFKFPDPESLSGAPILQLDEVWFRYENDQSYILENIDISCNLDTRLVIVGDNGSGKTTLLKLLNGFLEPNDFRVNFDPAEVTLIEEFDLYENDLIQWLNDFKSKISPLKRFKELKRYLSNEVLLFYFEFKETSDDYEVFETQLINKFYPKNKRNIFRKKMKKLSCEESAQFLINQFNSLSLTEARKLAFYLHEDEIEADRYLSDNYDIDIVNQKKKLIF